MHLATVVLIHGIGQQYLSADSLEAEWIPALAGGVRTSGFGAIADQLRAPIGSKEGISSRMAYYGDLFLDPETQGGWTEAQLLAQYQIMESLALEWLQRAALRSSDPVTKLQAQRELAYLSSEHATDEQGIRSIARSAVRSLARVPWFSPLGFAFAQRFVNTALAQVSLYLTDDTIRREIHRRVRALIGPETRVLLGHSLGSVIAYEVARETTHPLPLLLTVGSPLGLGTIIYARLRPQPPTFPLTVRRWHNVSDLNDCIAAEPDLTGLFSSGMPEESVFEGCSLVDNGSEPHRAQHYLTKKEVGSVVGKELSRS